MGPARHFVWLVRVGLGMSMTGIIPAARWRRLPWLAVALLLAGLAGCQSAPSAGPWPDGLLTTSERSGFRATGTDAEVVDLLDRIARRSPIARRATLGFSLQGRELPLLILADPPVSTAAEAHTSGKLIVYLQASIHGGEVCGKPALLQLARQIALDSSAPDRTLLNDLIIVMCPVYNADGNDQIKPGNRGPAQNGPALGMGTRANAQGLDLNRDHMKLESPEARAMVRFLTEWDPAMTIDTHTTDGSLHQYALTYAAPQNPSGHPAPIEMTRDRMLPEVSRRLEKRTGLKTFFYGNFNKEHTIWATYSHLPRFATPYRGLRNRMSILSEAYAYATYEQRVTATREFVRQCLRWASEHHADIARTLDLADRQMVAASKGADGEKVGIRYKMTPMDKPATVLGVERIVDDDGEPTGELRNRAYLVQLFERFEPTLSVVRPYAYLIPETLTGVVEKLRQHGITMRRLASARTIDTELYTIDSIERAGQPFQGHRLVTVKTLANRSVRTWPAGTWVVPMDQPLATLALYLLEPESDDGLTTWGVLDGEIVEGGIDPIGRAMAPIEPGENIRP